MELPRRTRLTEADRALWASYASRIRPLAGRSRPLRPRCRSLPSRRRRGTAPLVAGRVSRRAARATGDRHAAGRRGQCHLAPLPHRQAAGGADARPARPHGAARVPCAGAFLRAAHAEGLRCVEVVTGQGGVLRRELPLWLNLPELRALVLAAAHPHAANPGSVRLLLRRAR